MRTKDISARKGLTIRKTPYHGITNCYLIPNSGKPLSIPVSPRHCEISGDFKWLLSVEVLRGEEEIICL